MPIPPKLKHGDNLANLFEKFNAVIDYLRETRLIAGSGVNISQIHEGTTIESTATASGATSSAPPEGHPFDATIINKGTEQSPSYYVRIYNSALPDSPYAGYVIVFDWSVSVPVTDLAITDPDGYSIRITVTYTEGSDPPFTVVLSLIPSGSHPSVGYTTYQKYIGSGNSESVTSTETANIEITGRWV